MGVDHGKRCGRQGRRERCCVSEQCRSRRYHHRNFFRIRKSLAAHQLRHPAESSFSSQKAARTAAAGKNAAHSTAGAPADVQAQIFSLATALGVPLASLSDAIRPLIDPTVPNPVEEVKRLREQLDLTKNLHEQVVQQKEEAIEEEHVKKPGVLDLIEEAFLD